jgi:hypothetical protein
VTDPQGPDAGHLGLEAISDLDEGLLSPAEAAAAREHLAGCAQCQDDQALLASVREKLAGEREIAMPDDVAARVFNALAELPPLTPEDRVAEPAQATVTTLPAPRQPNRATKPILIALGAAAAVTLIALGIVNLPHTSGSTASSAAGTSAAAAPAFTPITHTGRDYTRAGLGSQALALLPAGATAAAATSAAPASAGAAAATSGGAAAAATSAAATVTSAAAASSAAASSAPSAAGSAAGPAATPGAQGPADKPTSAASAAPTTDALAPLEQGDAAQTCLMSFEPKSGTPLAIDIGTLGGKPAIIGVFQDPGNSGRLQVLAVGPPACSLYSFALIAKP